MWIWTLVLSACLLTACGGGNSAPGRPPSTRLPRAEPPPRLPTEQWTRILLPAGAAPKELSFLEIGGEAYWHAVFPASLDRRTELWRLHKDRLEAVLNAETQAPFTGWCSQAGRDGHVVRDNPDKGGVKASGYELWWIDDGVAYPVKDADGLHLCRYVSGIRSFDSSGSYALAATSSEWGRFAWKLERDMATLVAGPRDGHPGKGRESHKFVFGDVIYDLVYQPSNDRLLLLRRWENGVLVPFVKEFPGEPIGYNSGLVAMDGSLWLVGEQGASRILEDGSLSLELKRELGDALWPAPGTDIEAPDYLTLHKEFSKEPKRRYVARQGRLLLLTAEGAKGDGGPIPGDPVASISGDLLYFVEQATRTCREVARSGSVRTLELPATLETPYSTPQRFAWAAGQLFYLEGPASGGRQDGSRLHREKAGVFALVPLPPGYSDWHWRGIYMAGGSMFAQLDGPETSGHRPGPVLFRFAYE